MRQKHKWILDQQYQAEADWEAYQRKLADEKEHEHTENNLTKRPDRAIKDDKAE